MSSGGAELEGLVVSLREAGREIEARLDTKIRYAQRLMEEAQQTLTELEVARARAEAAARGVPMEDPTATHRAELAAAESSLARARELERAQAEERAARERREEDERKKGKPRSFFAPVDELEDGEPGDENATLRDSGETRQGDPEGPNNGRAATRSDDRNADRARARDEGQDRDPRRDPDRERQQLSDVTRGLEPTAETESQRRVRELAEEGKSAREIAREVQRPVGEIELILALGRSDGPR